MVSERRLDEVRRFVKTQPLGVAALVIIAIFLLVALFAPWIAPHGPVEQDRAARLVGPESGHLFGTDLLGRDVLSRIIHGARISLYVGTVTTVASFIIGGTLGIVAGYVGRWVDAVVQAIVDALLCVPPLVLAIFIGALLGPSVRNVVIALTILSVPRMARIARGEMKRIRSLDYVESTTALGGSPLRIMLLHGLPNMLPSLIVVASLGFGNAIIAEAALSFLGVGTPPPNPSWGLMLSDSTTYFQIAPWLVIFPGVAISLIVLAFNLFGDTLRDFLDPKLVR
ncbi:MAG: ABC transporter permease [Acidimicrobiia bacterium]|nr:ABC transporter permease [Acidimicrobiia bacterium]